MPRIRLLVVSLLACSALSFAQKAPDGSESSSVILEQFPAAAFNLEAKSDSEPWRIVPGELVRSDAGQNRIEHPEFGSNQGRHGQKKQFVWQSTPNQELGTFAIAPDGADSKDSMCFKIRSYVVARDNKHSDSTHPVGYSTCQPAVRYGLKKVDGAGK